MVNSAAALGSAVLCHDDDGRVTIELNCDHGHCDEDAAAGSGERLDAPITVTQWADHCECRDIPLGSQLLRSQCDRSSRKQIQLDAPLAQPVMNVIALPVRTASITNQLPSGHHQFQALLRIRSVVLVT